MFPRHPSGLMLLSECAMSNLRPVMGVLAGKLCEIRQLGWTAVSAVRSIRDLDSALSRSRVSELETCLSWQ